MLKWPWTEHCRYAHTVLFSMLFIGGYGKHPPPLLQPGRNQRQRENLLTDDVPVAWHQLMLSHAPSKWDSCQHGIDEPEVARNMGRKSTAWLDMNTLGLYSRGDRGEEGCRERESLWGICECELGLCLLLSVLSSATTKYTIQILECYPDASRI